MRAWTAPSLPRVVIVLGFVSLFMDISSEMIHGLLPLYLTGVLGLNAMAVGFIEGVAEATASITKIFAGVLSDWIGKRKPLVLLGYGMAALTKPLFPLADGASAIFTARFLDRMGKGIRGAPRDALIADLTPPEIRGAAYGARQSMDTIGAFAGPALGMLFMALSHGNYRLVFWIAVIPAFLAVACVLFGVDEPERPPLAERRPFPLHRSEIARLGRPFWTVVVVLAVLTLARFSEAFLLLRAANLGLPAAWTPAVLILMNIVFGVSAYPLGRLADRYDQRRLLAAGIALLIAADVTLALAGSLPTALLGCALWGLHMGATQGLLSAMVAATAPDDLRATAFGLFNLVAGGALLAASLIAGFLWHHHGPAAPFLAAALLSFAALLGLRVVAHPTPVENFN